MRHQGYILDWSIGKDDASVCRGGRTIIIDMVGDRLQCTQVIPNGEYGYMRKEIASSTRTWTQVNGSHENFNTVYTMEDGAVLSHKKLSEFLRHHNDSVQTVCGRTENQN